MLFEHIETSLEPRFFQIAAGLFLGLVFGAFAQISRLCLRRAVAGPTDERGSAAAVWITALTSAVLGFGAMSALGFVDLADHRLLSADIPIAAVVVGGLLFGAGMILTRGCASRLTVLSATGNLRAVLVLTVLAITSHATMKGVLAPLRTSLGSYSFDLTHGTVFSSTIGFGLVLLLLVAGSAMLVWRSRPSALSLISGAVIGLVAIGGWVATSTLLFDEFDPLAVQTAAFIQPWSDTLFWTIASSAVPAGFAVGFLFGVLVGSFLSAAARGELTLVTFETPKQTVVYISGGVLMGVGGVLAGGCTIGAGLSGVATGSITAMIALISIVVGGWAASTTFRKVNLSPALA